MKEVTMPATNEDFIQGAGGRLFVRSWRPTNPARAVVAICHGFNAHSGMYQWVGEQVAGHGFAAYALDLRGRGRSEGERYYADSFDEYVDDLQMLIDLVKEREPGVAVFLLGHSAGGVVSCLHSIDHKGETIGLICEDFAFELPAPDFALGILKAISHLAPHAHSIAIKNEDFSRDPAVVQKMNEDPLIRQESQPFATMAAIVRADNRLKQAFPDITLPVLIIHGTDDRAAKVRGSQQFYELAGSTDKTLKLYEGRFHDPLNDLGKEEVMADILRWMAERVPT
jgi:acylglycerol lipase